eukprot:332851-Chlamydomonas_euryale.AAC.1
MHGSREGRAMQGSSSKDQLQQCMAAAERGQLLTCMATVERGSLSKDGWHQLQVRSTHQHAAAVWGGGWDAAMVGSTNDKTAAMNRHHLKEQSSTTAGIVGRPKGSHAITYIRLIHSASGGRAVQS